MELILDRTSWVTFCPSEDIEGVWVAHHLDLDVVTQGVGFLGAREALLDAVRIVVEDDMEHGLNPFDRKPAPEEYWDPVWKLLFGKSKVSLSSVPESEWDRLSFVAAQLNVKAQRADDVEEMIVPDAFVIAATQSVQHGHC